MALRTLGDRICRIGLICRIGPNLFLFRSFGHASTGQLFAVATLLDELSFQGFDLAVQQVVCLMDQADDGVRADFRAFVVQPSGDPTNAT